ncbi:MAG TPA: TIM barrel protein [Saprospiraceae bacterium]|nr:TIM barrel protein [Lewinellaceae bacterium]HPR01202.1 TIM barrel protein [Saprospiraceae bacterium]HQU51960.1 TIM barrel protein [Saprospiraceae bacterium]HRV86917.1 TIM barrel protein [Saprospiraceae bacterium]
MKRRKFLQNSAIYGAGMMIAPSVMNMEKDLFFKISLAEWSFHKALFAKEIDHLDFAKIAKQQYGIEGVEYVNQFFKDKAKDMDYLKEMKMRAEGEGVRSLLIMCDGEGGLGDTNESQRKTAVENHYKWVEAAKFLGCHSIRVNAYGEGTAAEVASAAIDGLGSLAGFAKDYDLNVIVENHGGYSSNGKWLTDVMKQIDMPNCGTLPDFGNFCLKGTYENGKMTCEDMYDRYQGVSEMMPFAKAVSAKTHAFDASGNETETDYLRMMKIVKDAGYKGFVGIEYEGNVLSEADGVRASKALLMKVGAELS